MINLDEVTKPFFSNSPIIEIPERISLLKKLKEVIQTHSDEILEALKKDLGKSEFEAYLGEIDFSVSEINHTLKNIKKWIKPKRVGSSLVFFPAKSYIYQQPLGRVLIIGPWNYPFQLLMAPLVGAIAAGNSVILKPSEISSNTSKVIFKIIKDNFEPHRLLVVEGAVKETTFLLNRRFDHIFYTGNGRVGKIVMEKAAKFLTPLTLELGGKSPTLVFTDKIDLAAKRIMWGKFFNAGQTCTAPDYVLIEKENRLEFVDSCRKWIKVFYGENIKESQDYGRIINEVHFDRITSYIKESEILLGGDRDREQSYISPTLLLSAIDSPSMRDEIFGPVLPIIEVDSFESAVEIIKENPNPLACYGFLNNRYIANFLKIKAGGMTINDTIIHISNQNLPFGGVGESGMGQYHGKFSFETFSHQKAVMKRSFWFENSLRYPPYKGKLALVRKILDFF